MDQGEGPALLLLHGLPGSARDFRYLAPLLGALRCVRPDLPGFGGTARRHRGAWSLPQRAELVVRLLDHLGIDRVVVGGHSMGGAVAVAVAEAAPDRVAGLAMLAGPGPFAHQGYVRSRLSVLGRVFAIPGSTRLLGSRLKAGFVAAGFPSSTPVHEMVSSVRDGGQLRFDEHARRLERVSVPALVAWAQDDRLIEAAVSEALSNILPEGPRLVWPEGGHNIQKTHAAELASALRSFVADTR